jgi:uncharacterized membrane protein
VITLVTGNTCIVLYICKCSTRLVNNVPLFAVEYFATSSKAFVEIISGIACYFVSEILYAVCTSYPTHLVMNRSQEKPAYPNECVCVCLWAGIAQSVYFTFYIYIYIYMCVCVCVCVCV